MTDITEVMQRSDCARLSVAWRAGAALSFAMLAWQAAPVAAARGGNDATGSPDGLEAIKRFDFDERPLGNYEALPMRWQRVSGPGLPAYSAGELDDQVGHDAPPSFAFHLQGGQIGYEYEGRDILVLPDSDYVITAYVRSNGLTYARALLHAWLIDSAGERVAGSDRITALAGDERDSGAGEWQRIETRISGDFPSACFMGLGLWVVQPKVWEPPDPAELDPIVRQDVAATVWFDDIAVIRLPRASLRCTSPGSLIRPGETGELAIKLFNSAPEVLPGELRIRDASGHEVHMSRHAVPAQSSSTFSVRIPDLAPGLYTAQMHVGRGEEAFRYRTVRFAVLSELSPRLAPAADIGIDLGRAETADVDGLLALVEELGCGAAKLGIEPPAGAPTEEAVLTSPGWCAIRELARGLVGCGVDVTGVLLEGGATGPATRSGPISSRDRCTRAASAIADLAGIIDAWQLGEDRPGPDTGPTWDSAALAELRRQSRQLLADPQLITCYSAMDGRLSGDAENLFRAPEGGAREAPERPDAISIEWPAQLPTHAIPSQLSFLADRPEKGTDEGFRSASSALACHLTLDFERDDLDPTQAMAEWARRFIVAKALNPDRLYITAPLELSTAGGQPAWQPTDEFIRFRRLCHLLGGKRAVAAFPLPAQDGVAVLFDGPRGATLAAWTWRDRAPATPAELQLGPAPVATDLPGQHHSLEVRERRSQLPLTPTPLIVNNVDAPLIRLQASFRVEPATVESHGAENAPVLHVQNYYAQELAGTLEVTPPEGWRLADALPPLRLQAGEALDLPLRLELPPHEFAAEHHLRVRIELRSPNVELLEFDVPIAVTLHGFRTQTTAQWEGTKLIVTHTITNLTGAPVSFSAFCQVPRRRRLEHAFLDIAPGETQKHLYTYSDARDLGGSPLRVGIREIHGERSLDELVEIPD